MLHSNDNFHLQKKKAKCLFDFKSESDEELGFRKGDEVEILEELDENWWKGRLNDQEGLFPATYVQVLDK